MLGLQDIYEQDERESDKMVFEAIQDFLLKVAALGKLDLVRDLLNQKV